jgi:hypothetical protein
MQQRHKGPDCHDEQAAPTGKPQPYQVIAFCAYFQASGSIWFASLLMLLSVQTSKVLSSRSATQLFSRSLG